MLGMLFPKSSNADTRNFLQLWLRPKSALPLLAFNVIVAVFFVLVFWREHSREDLTVWLVVIIGLSVLEIAFRRLGCGLSQLSDDTTARLVLVVDVMIGCCWAYASWRYFSAELPYLLLFFLLLIAICTVVFQHLLIVPMVLRVGVALPVAALQVYGVGDNLSIVQASVLIAIWLGVLFLGLRLHFSVRQRVALIASRNSLLAKVEESARELDQARVREEESRRQAESANLAKSRFLAHSSHDLRQPLHATSLLLESIDDEQLDEQTTHTIGRVRKSVESLAGLFDSLLDLTLLDTGQVSIRHETFEVSEVIKEIGFEFSAAATHHQVALITDPTSRWIHSDITVIRRILQNLVANAIRHADGQQVSIVASERDDGIWLEVRDTGIGISEQDQVRIFEEFTRLDSNRMDKSYSSLGLGLAIVSRLAKLIQKQIDLTSEPGRGSVFRVGPFKMQSAAVAKTLRAERDKRSMEPLRVLIVDDDPDTLRATGKLLKKWRFVVEMNNGIEPLSQDKPDVLICDFELGDHKTGVDIMREVRQEHGSVIPALLISGNTSPELAALALTEGVPLLHKPVRAAQLKSAILTLLGNTAKRSQTSQKS
ncbi:MAG: hybrid sensor histidine kinase/response regulator [Pseudomonadota bacterium]